MTEYRNGRAMSAGRKVALCLSTVLCSGLAAPLHAQVAGRGSEPPVRQAIDANGIDVLRGTQTVALTDVTIGPDDFRGLAYNRINGVATVAATIEQGGPGLIVTLHGRSTSFSQSGSTYVSTEGDGATLVNQGGIYVYTASDGTVAQFASNQGFTYSFYEGEFARLGSVTYPDGTTEAYTYKTQTYCPAGYESGRTCQGILYYVARLQGVKNSNGYQLKISYASNAVRVDDTNYADWGRVTSVRAINNAVEYCDSAADSCSLTGSWPAATYDAAGNATDAAGRPVKSYVTTTTSGGQVTSANHDGIVYGYSYVDAGSTRTTTVTDPNGKSKVYVGDTTTFLISSVRDELNRTTSYTYDGSGRVLRVTAPEGNQTVYEYDLRGNVTKTTAKAKAGFGLADIVTTAGYDASCANAKTCNKPNWTKDAKGNQSDYTYDANHGGLLTATAPAPSVGAVRPQTRYSYAQLSGYYKQSATGTPVGGGAAYVLTATSVCQTTASCAGGADEVKVTIGYGPQMTGTGNNLLPVSVASGSGDGVLTATATSAYDTIGNLLAVDGPLAGTGDTARYRYDAARLVIGVTGPDPDGGGALKNRAARLTYNSDRLPILIERGTVNSQTDADWAGFVTLQQAGTTYDAGRRKLTNTVSASGTNYALSQYSYDTLGRADCSAMRMNPAAFGSLPGAACTLGMQGSYGPDRVVKTSYDDASEVVKVTSAFGTADESDDMSYGYTLNGRPTTLTDAKGNVTTTEYDGFDRVTKTRFPNVSGGGSSTTDYLQPGYDVNGNMVSQRLRNGNSITYTYDALNRLTATTVPTGNNNLNRAFAYDNLDRLTQGSATGIYTSTLGYTYDALGRALSESSGLNGRVTFTKAMQYDLAGRRTRLTWSDGFYVTYDYDTVGAMTVIRENGAASGIGVLATFAYDDLGRRTSLTRGNGTVTSYGYDAVSRLTSLGNDLAGTAYDLSLTFGSYNPAGQIGSRTASNDTYAWTGAASGTKSYTTNGLNQYTAAAGQTPTYDPRGNLTGLNGTTFGYSVENDLALVGTSSRLYYDPLHRMVFSTFSTGFRRFERDGGVIAAEYTNADTLIHRYVFGPGGDEPLVWYDYTTTPARRWLHADERGSVVAISDDSGAKYYTNSYDEYGVPALGNTGRFQYTGQAYIPEIGMYDYKARVYAPALGRFVQTDPLGYLAGPNVYGYVAGDPINRVDPTGLQDTSACVTNPTTCGRTSAPNDTTEEHGLRVDVPAGPDRNTNSCNACNSTPSILTSDPFSLSIFQPSVSSYGDAVDGNTSSSESDSGTILESTRKGERGRAANNQGTPDPYKHMKPAPDKPGFGQVKDPQTGKLSGPKPWPTDPRLTTPESKFTSIVVVGGSILLLGGILIFPEITVPALLFSSILSTQ